MLQGCWPVHSVVKGINCTMHRHCAGPASLMIYCAPLVLQRMAAFGPLTDILLELVSNQIITAPCSPHHAVTDWFDTNSSKMSIHDLKAATRCKHA